METKLTSYDIAFKMALPLLILMASIIFVTPTWANKPSHTGQTLNTQETFTLAYRDRRYHRGWNGGRYWRPGWGYRVNYWSPWRPYWRSGIYCRKRCLINRWGRVVRCRVSC